jgi:signal transduction histidine kinase
MWLGTDDGLVKFNGREFMTYSESHGLTNSYAIDIQPYAKDTLVIGTWGGGLHFFTNETFTKLMDNEYAKINEVTVDGDAIYGNLIKYKKENGEWIKTYFVFDEEGVKIEKSQQEHAISMPQFTWIEDQLIAHGQLIKGRRIQNFKGLYELKKDTLKLLFPFMKNRVIHAITKLDENKFVASEEDKVYVFSQERILEEIPMNFEGRLIVKFTKFDENNFFFLASDPNGFKRAFRYNLKTRKLIDIGKTYGINSTVSDIKLDFENNVWLSTYGEGIYQIPYSSFDVQTVFDRQDVTKILSFRDKIYALRAGDLFEFDDQKLTNTYKLTGFAKYMQTKEDKIEVFSLISDNTDIKINDFIIEKRGTFGFYNDKFEIISTDSLMVNGKKYENDLSKNINQMVYMDEGKYMTATNLGLYVFDDSNFTLTPTPYEELSTIRVSDIEKQDDFYWIATSQGLFKLKDQQLQKISIGDGLLSDNIKDLMMGSDGRLWIATVKGLSVYDGQSFVNITQKENLLSNNINGVFEDDEHNIWIATVKGISILTSKNQNVKQAPPIINVFQNEEGFNYDVISYSSWNNLFTQYQINDQPWTISTTNTLDFKNFKEGKYTFRLRSKRPQSDWQYSEAYTFHVRVPLYKKTVFVVFVILLISLSIISLIFLQLKKSKKTNRLLTKSIQKQKELEAKLTTVRENIAEDFHDDLGNKLASITILTDILSNKVTSKESKGIVDQILSHSDSLYKGTKDFIWTLKKESDQIEEMVTYLSDFGEDFFQQLNIQFRIEKCIESNVQLPYYWSRHLILIFKEAMTNAAKHSQCTETVIEFNFRNNELQIAFKDNGIGFDPKNVSIENGLRNMEDRAHKIGGELICNSSENGTEIKFTGKVYPE